MRKILTLRLNRFVPLCLLALAATVLLTPAAANATTITYDFTVTATSGPLNGTVSHGTFSFDSSSITPGTLNSATELLTGIDFTWNGTAYNTVSASVNEGWLGFDPTGQLDSFLIGNNCSSGLCLSPGGTDTWLATDR